MAVSDLERRQFLKPTAAGGGLLIGFHLPSLAATRDGVTLPLNTPSRRVPANTAPTINASPRCARSNGASSKPMTREMRLAMVLAPQRAGKVPTELT